MVIFHSYVKLPEGNHGETSSEKTWDLGPRKVKNDGDEIISAGTAINQVVKPSALRMACENPYFKSGIPSGKRSVWEFQGS